MLTENYNLWLRLLTHIKFLYTWEFLPNLKEEIYLSNVYYQL